MTSIKQLHISQIKNVNVSNNMFKIAALYFFQEIKFVCWHCSKVQERTSWDQTLPLARLRQECLEINANNFSGMKSSFKVLRNIQ